MNLSRQTKTTTDALRLLNWNVRGFSYQLQGEVSRSLLRVAGGSDFDCVVLTEVPRSGDARLEILNSFEGNGWSMIATPSTPESTLGIAIASRGSRLAMVASAETPNIAYLVVKATFGTQNVLILGVRVKTCAGDTEDYRTRAKGIESLSNQIAQLQIDHPGLVMIGAGDFNHGMIRGPEDLRDDDEIARFYRGLAQAPVAFQRIASIWNQRHGLVLHTPTSGFSFLHLNKYKMKLDHVFATQGVPVTTTYGPDNWGSDHWPQSANIQLAGSGRPGE